MIFKFIFKSERVIKSVFKVKFNNEKVNNYKNKKMVIKKKLKNVNKHKSYKKIKCIKDKIFNYFIYKLTYDLVKCFYIFLKKAQPNYF